MESMPLPMRPSAPPSWHALMRRSRCGSRCGSCSPPFETNKTGAGGCTESPFRLRNRGGRRTRASLVSVSALNRGDAIMRLSAIMAGCVVALVAMGARADTSHQFIPRASSRLAQSLCNQAKAESCNDEQLNCLNTTHNSMACCTSWKTCMGAAGCDQIAVSCH